MDQLETRVNRKLTRAFIKVDQYMVSFNRPTQVSDGKGGRTETTAVITAQPVRVVPARTRSTSQTYTLPTGEVISSKDMFLLGDYNLNVEHNDWFMWQGRAFQISYVEPDRTYQTLCQLDEMGETDRSTY